MTVVDSNNLHPHLQCNFTPFCDLVALGLRAIVGRDVVIVFVYFGYVVVWNFYTDLKGIVVECGGMMNLMEAAEVVICDESYQRVNFLICNKCVLIWIK